tara:strand:+ start:419 stop:1081 length:663 start_codon:yes stop_codon:yes gene_type:complete
MNLDLHSHSVSSDDSRATVEQYLKWIVSLRKKGYVVDGIVLTEHRKFDIDINYTQLSEKYDVLVLKGSELDTRHGHFLVYGVTKQMLDKIDFGNVKMDSIELMRIAQQSGAIAFPAHPGRFGIGFCEYSDTGLDFNQVGIVEHLNGSYRAGELERTEKLISEKGYLGTGGSDAHFVSAIATCLTDFQESIHNEKDLVEALNEKTFKAITLEETKIPGYVN